MVSGTLQKRKTSLQNLLCRRDEGLPSRDWLNLLLHVGAWLASVSDGLCALCHQFTILNAI